MLNQRFSIAKTLFGAIVALTLTAAPALAARHGPAVAHHSAAHVGSVHAGSFHSGYRGNIVGYHNAYRGNIAGYHNAYRGTYGYHNAYRGAYGYRGGYYGLGLGLSAYPYDYGYNYYPYDYGYNYDYSPTYVTPPATNVIVAPDTGVAPSAYYSPAPVDDQAHIEVLTPSPDAQVFFDGAPTQQQGTDREFVSPPLTPGQTYRYTIEARWMQNGRMVDQSRVITVTAGQDATVDFGR